MLVTGYPIDVAPFAGRRTRATGHSPLREKQSIRGLVWCRRAFRRILIRHHEHRL
jgi:hypothetical protein